MTSSTVTVRTGELAAWRIFDIAYAIDLAVAAGLWQQQAGAPGRRMQLQRTPAKAMAFGVPPLELELDAAQIELDGDAWPLRGTARLYDFGVVALSLRVPLRDLPWTRYVRLFAALEQALGAAADAGPWRQRLDVLRDILAPALERPATKALEEDFLLATVRTLEPPLDAEALCAELDLAALLCADPLPLAPSTRTELLQRRFSYYADDLVVLNWDRAFIHDPRGDEDVADVIEVANVQLLELRYYQALLDDELPHMYRRVHQARGTSGLLASHRFANLARRLHALAAEVGELTARLDNVLQVTEDVYLARVYAAALDLLRVRSLGAGLERRLAGIRDTYAALYDEASSRRAELLEVAIVLLIVVEVVLALWRH